MIQSTPNEGLRDRLRAEAETAHRNAADARHPEVALANSGIAAGLDIALHLLEATRPAAPTPEAGLRDSALAHGADQEQLLADGHTPDCVHPDQHAALRDDHDDLTATVERVRGIPRLPHASQQIGELGRAYTRGWESVIAALDAALDQPKEQQ